MTSNPLPSRSSVDGMEGYRAQVVVDVQRFKEAVWAVERENFRPGNALDALEQATVGEGGDPAATRGAVAALDDVIRVLEAGDDVSLAHMRAVRASLLPTTTGGSDAA